MATAAELFLKNFAQIAYNSTNGGQGQMLDYGHLAELIQTDDKFLFLRGLIPRKVRYGDVVTPVGVETAIAAAAAASMPVVAAPAPVAAAAAVVPAAQFVAATPGVAGGANSEVQVQVGMH